MNQTLIALSRCGALVASLVALTSIGVANAKQPPPVYTDQGACPGEGCSYGPWRVVRSTTVFDRPTRRGKQIARLRRGASVNAVTGFVRTRAGQFVVYADTGRYRAGDVLWVYTYRGEGRFLVWHAGKMYKEDLGFSPWGGTAGTRCEKDPRCWGRLDAEHESEWWVKVRLRDGRLGWTNRTRDYVEPDYWQ